VICLDDRLAIVTINTAAETLFAVSGRQLRSGYCPRSARDGNTA